MPFKPNYSRERFERGKAARARNEEKQKKKDEKTAQRKAEREATDPSAGDQSAAGDAPVVVATDEKQIDG